jgi:hypothetical protein
MCLSRYAVLKNLAEVLAKLDQHAEALEVCLQASDMNTTSGWLLFHEARD